MTTQDTTVASGNTIQRLPSGRDWQFTLNDVNRYDELKSYLTGLKSLRYFISCIETAPTTGHEHIHIFTQFTKPFRPSIRKSCGAHIERCRGTPQQNVEYIKKDGRIIDEVGDVRSHGGYPMTIAELKAMDKDDVPPALANVYKRLTEESDESIDIDEIHKTVKVIYIWGPSGVGKSKLAYDIARELGYHKIHQLKYESGFYHGLGHGEGCAIYDDFRDSHMRASEFINLIDYNVHPMNRKGGSVLNRFDTIIITSVQNPERIYHAMDDEPRKQWMRRIEVRHLMTNCQDDSEAVSISS